MPTTLFSFYASDAHLDLPSFPTRRSSDLPGDRLPAGDAQPAVDPGLVRPAGVFQRRLDPAPGGRPAGCGREGADRKSTRLNSSHLGISYAVFCLKKKKKNRKNER